LEIMHLFGTEAFGLQTIWHACFFCLMLSCYFTIFLSAVAVFPNVRCKRNQKKRPCEIEVEIDEGLFMLLLVKSGKYLYLCSFILQVLLGAENLRTQSKYQCSQVPNSRIKTGVASCLLSISSDCCSSHRRPSHPDDRITCVCILPDCNTTII
jgi:hypothetical protein